MASATTKPASGGADPTNASTTPSPASNPCSATPPSSPPPSAGAAAPQTASPTPPGAREHSTPAPPPPPGPGPPPPPWPGQLPPLAPTTVYRQPHPVTLFTHTGNPVDVTDRGALTGAPATITGARGTLRIHAWAGPWPTHERWWDTDTAQHTHRIQAVDTSGAAWLLGHRDGGWWLEARYD